MQRVIWSIRGKVVHGHGRGGSQLGFPTANISLDATALERLKPMENGVYFGWAQVEGQQPPSKQQSPPVHPMVMSVGFNPHFKDQSCTVEVHMIHKFSQDFYGTTIRVLVCDKLREMTAFTTLEALVEIIRDDIRIATGKLTSDFANLQHCEYFLSPPPQGSETVVQIPQSVKKGAKF